MSRLRPVARRALPACLALLALARAAGAAPAAVPGAPALAEAPPALRFSEALYQAGDSYRSESELLRWLHGHPRHPWRGRAELARARLYHRAGRYDDATLMLLSLLDRLPDDPAAEPATGLLALALARQGRLDEAEPHLWALGRGGAPPDLATLRGPAPGEVAPERAVAWSTWLPGASFFLVDQPAQAAAGLALNVAFLAGAVVAWQQDNPGAALVLALVEVALYRGGREAARDAAEAHNRRLRAERLDAWARTAGEPELLSVGVTVGF